MSTHDAKTTNPPRPERSAAERLWGIWHEISTLYEHYARSQGFSSTSLAILDEVWRAQLDGRPCTQKAIGERTFLPKQTINTVVSGLQRDGVVELAARDDDRRVKDVRLTTQGLALAERVIAPEDAAEEDVLAQFTPEEREQLLGSLARFASALRARLEA